jgi:hypothetical protein
MTRRGVLGALFLALIVIAAGYAGAFNKTATPVWAAWMLALGIPVALGAIMILGALRGSEGIGALKFPFAFVIIILAIGFGAALALPASDGPTPALPICACAAACFCSISSAQAAVLP